MAADLPCGDNSDLEDPLNSRSPMYQRWQMSRSDAHPLRGAYWPGLSRRQGEIPQTLTEEWFLYPQTWRQVSGELNPSDTKNNPSPTDPIHPQTQWGRDPSRPPNLPVVSFVVPTLMTLVAMAVVWMYGSLTIPAQDIIEGGQWCRVQTLMWDIPCACPCPLLFQTWWHLCKGGPSALTLGLVPCSSSK